MARSVPPLIRLLPSCNILNRTTSYKVFIIIFTFLCYTSYHLSRKPISIVKSVLHQKNCSVPLYPGGPVYPANSTQCDWGPFDGGNYGTLLGSLDNAYLAAYAIGMFFSGHLAERMNLRYFLSAGMILSGIFTAAFGFGQFFNIHSFWFFILIQIFGGLFQSTGWPSVVACMGNWYGKGKRGLIMGIWNSHTSVGNILGSLIAGVWVNHHWGWSFVVPGIIIGSLGVMVFLTLVTEPSIVGCEEPQQQLPGEVEEEEPNDDKEVHGPRHTAINADSYVEPAEGKTTVPGDIAVIIETTTSLHDKNDVPPVELNGSINNDVKMNGAVNHGTKMKGDVNHAKQNGAIHHAAKKNGAVIHAAKMNGAVKHDAKMNGAINNGAKMNGAVNNGAKMNGAVNHAFAALDGDLTRNVSSDYLVEKAKNDKNKKSGNESTSLLVNSQQGNDKAISFIRALLIPGVLEFSFCLFCAKLVSYTFLFWLPKYISYKADYGAEKAGDLSTLFDVGGILGGITAGVISDYTGARASTCCLMLILAAPIMFVYNEFGSIDYAHSVGLLLLCGFMVNGPYALITTAVSADLGTHKSLQGSTRALATVTAIIDGTGSIGAALGPLLTGIISKSGWNNVFWMLITADLCAMVFLFRLVYKEVRAKLYPVTRVIEVNT